MRIDPTVLTPVADSLTSRTRDSSRPPPAHSPSSVVSLGAGATPGRIDPTIAERIERLREQIVAGEYSVDLDHLAESILDDDLARMVGS